jgi:hypothetical protein
MPGSAAIFQDTPSGSPGGVAGSTACSAGLRFNRLLQKVFSGPSRKADCQNMVQKNEQDGLLRSVVISMSAGSWSRSGGMGSKKMDAIIEKANRQRSALPAGHKTGERKTPGRRGPYAFTTYWAMRAEWAPSMKLLFVWSIVYALCFFSTVYLAAARSANPAMELPLHVSLILSTLCVLKIVHHQLAAVLTYPLYPRWLQRLAFRVEGWEALAGFAGFADRSNFMGVCTIALDLNEHDGYGSRVMEAALDLFCLEANRAFLKFYDNPDFKTFSHSGNTASGSVNCAIAGKMYRFIKRELRRINRELSIIARVELRVNNTIVTATELPKHDSV